MDDIGCAVKTFDELIPTLRQIFVCIRKSGLKTSPGKCSITTQRMQFPGRVITPKGISPEKEKKQKFLKHFRMHRTLKQIRRIFAFAQFFRNFIPNLGLTLLPFYKLLKKDTKTEPSKEHYDSLEKLKANFLAATETTLGLPKPGLKYVLLRDAITYGAVFVLVVENYPVKGYESQKFTIQFPLDHTYSTKVNSNFPPITKKFLGLYYALENFAHFLWCSHHSVLILTNNKKLVQFFQSKVIPPTLWNYLDRLLSFNLVTAHTPGKANYAAEFLSRIQTDKNACLRLKMKDKIPVTEIEIDTKALTRDVETNKILKEITTVAELTPEIIKQLQKIGMYDEYMQKTQLDNQISELFIPTVATINAMCFPNPEDILENIVNKQHTQLVSKKEQNKDDNIRQVIQWKKVLHQQT